MNASKYEIIHKENCNDYIVRTINFENGTAADIKTPCHTPEEIKQLSEQITAAAFKLIKKQGKNQNK